VHADRADLDDAVARRIESGGLEIDRDEVYAGLLLGCGRSGEGPPVTNDYG